MGTIVNSFSIFMVQVILHLGHRISIRGEFHCSTNGDCETYSDYRRLGTDI